MHYYPFGLTMSGISSKALAFGGAENKLKYGSKEEQCKEFSDGSGMELYDYDARYYDRQTGRWHGIDKMAESYSSMSPYNFINDNPINGIDPSGKDVIFLNDTKGANVSGNMNAGHAAVIIGNSKDGWFYYSLNGTGDGQSAIGDSKDPDIGTFLGNGTDINELITGPQGANNINRKEKHEYDRYVIIKTTPEEDRAMKKKAEKAASVKTYIVIGQSCLNVPKAAYFKLVNGRVGYAHRYIDETTKKDATPNTWFDNLPETFNNLNSYMQRWGAGNGMYFQSPPKRTGKVIIGPITPDPR